MFHVLSHNIHYGISKAKENKGLPIWLKKIMLNVVSRTGFCGADLQNDTPHHPQTSPPNL